MEDHYSFGIEIEMIARPREAHTPLEPPKYYEQFAIALKARGVNARSDDLRAAYRKRTEEYSRGWWITRDGSVASTADASTFLPYALKAY